MGSRDNRFSVYVGNLPPNTLQSHFNHIFPNCQVNNVRLIRNKETDEFKGYGYVDFADEESYKAALKVDGSFIEGKRIRVNAAQDRRGVQGPRGGGVGGSGGVDGNGGGSSMYNGSRCNNRGGRGGDDNWLPARGYRSSMAGGGGYASGGGEGGWRYSGRNNRGTRGGGGRGNSAGGRMSYQPLGLSQASAGFPAPTSPRSNLEHTGEGNSNSSSDENRPRLNLKPRTRPAVDRDDRELSERAKAIFGLGKPREASPVREN